MAWPGPLAIRVTLLSSSSPSPADPGDRDAAPGGAGAPLLEGLPPVVPVAAVNAAVDVPVGWLLDKGSDALRARVLLDLEPGALTPEAAEAARKVALAQPAALRLAVAQGSDGLWPGGLLAVPPADDAAVDRAGAIPAIRRLLEYGWPTDAPPFQAARRPLFRLLAEDGDPSVLMELRDDATDEARARLLRRLVREGAGAALAQMGLETDPRLRGLAVRTLERVMAWLKLVEKGERTPEGAPVLPAVLPEDAAPPSAHVLVMLAHMPRFRNEQTETIGRLIAFLTQPPPTTVPKLRVGAQAVPQPQLVLGDPVPPGLEPTGKALVPGLAWLEVLARLGAFRRSDRWRPVLDRLLDARDPDGRWTQRVSVPAPDPFVWPVAALGDPTSGAQRAADVTFRLALIARLAGYPLVLR